MDFDTSTCISHQDIINFPFPYKLWIIVNSETCDFAKWNIDGTELEVKIIALDCYLSNPKSIFKIKNRSCFLDHLRIYGFEKQKPECCSQAENITTKKEERFDVWPGYSEFVIKFKHENFLRHRIDLLAKIRKIHYTRTLSLSEGEPKPVDRMDGDLCSMCCGALSQIQKLRINYQAIVNFQSETNILQEKLLASEIRSKTKNQDDDEEDPMIELPAELFENPHDSVLYMGDEHQSTYAGFYGNCSEEQVLNFFADYLPMYENSNENDVERRIVDLNPTRRMSSSQAINIEISYPLDAETTNQSDDIPQQSSPTPPLSSSLQPIFSANEDEEDISMDEFIKFKEQTVNTEPIQSTEPAKIKMELLDEGEDNENEANFKNFFSQYRESLSLLYERQ